MVAFPSRQGMPTFIVRFSIAQPPVTPETNRIRLVPVDAAIKPIVAMVVSPAGAAAPGQHLPVLAAKPATKSPRPLFESVEFEKHKGLVCESSGQRGWFGSVSIVGQNAVPDVAIGLLQGLGKELLAHRTVALHEQIMFVIVGSLGSIPQNWLLFKGPAT